MSSLDFSPHPRLILRQSRRLVGHELLAGQRVAPDFGLGQVDQAGRGQIAQRVEVGVGFGVEPSDPDGACFAGQGIQDPAVLFAAAQLDQPLSDSPLGSTAK